MKRPWFDFPDKCSACSLIDRTATDQDVQRHLGLAHQLHRDSCRNEKSHLFNMLKNILCKNDVLLVVIACCLNLGVIK